MNTIKKSKQTIWREMALNTIEISKHGLHNFNMSLEFIEEKEMGSILFGFIILNYFQDLMMGKGHCM